MSSAGYKPQSFLKFHFHTRSHTFLFWHAKHVSLIEIKRGESAGGKRAFRAWCHLWRGLEDQSTSDKGLELSQDLGSQPGIPGSIYSNSRMQWWGCISNSVWWSPHPRWTWCLLCGFILGREFVLTICINHMPGHFGFSFQTSRSSAKLRQVMCSSKCVGSNTSEGQQLRCFLRDEPALACHGSLTCPLLICSPQQLQITVKWFN